MAKGNDFSDMAPEDMVRLVAATALTARESGGTVEVSNGRLSGVVGVLIFIPGYAVVDGEMNKVIITGVVE